MNHKWDLIWIIQRRYERRQPLCYILAIAAMNNDITLCVITYFLLQFV